MGFRGRLVFLMIVYFAGFATAIYYLAPSGAKAADQNMNFSNSQPGEPAQSSMMDRFLEKASSKASSAFSGMSKDNFKEKFNLGLEKLRQISARSDTDKASGTEEQ